MLDYFNMSSWCFDLQYNNPPIVFILLQTFCFLPSLLYTKNTVTLDIPMQAPNTYVKKTIFYIFDLIFYINYIFFYKKIQFTCIVSDNCSIKLKKLHSSYGFYKEKVVFIYVLNNKIHAIILYIVFKYHIL